ncbi:hypothetical protein ACFOEQ_26855 [Chryseobacterium arachidis]
MGTQICPKCKRNSFTWSIDDEVSNFTSWGCHQCFYQAEENESDECICESCGNKTKMKLKDNQTEYWWCCRCNKITLIKRVLK